MLIPGTDVHITSLATTEESDEKKNALRYTVFWTIGITSVPIRDKISMWLGS